MLDDDKNAGVCAVWGDLYRSPFTGGFFTVNVEHSWQRFTSCTDAGEKQTRARIRQEVVNKFAQDSFLRFSARDHGRVLFQALRPAGFTGAPHEIGFDQIDAKMNELFLLPREDSPFRIENQEFFDHRTSYADIILPGMAKTVVPTPT